MNRRELEMSAACAAALFALLALPQPAVAAVKPDEARAIAKDAYIYGYPLVESYRILYSYFVDRSNPEYKAAWNEKVANNARVFTPADVAMGTPNADTPIRISGSICAPSPWCSACRRCRKTATTRRR